MRRSFAHSAPIGEPRRRFVDKGVARFVRDARAQVAELVDALVSGTSDASRGGSSPLLGTSLVAKPLSDQLDMPCCKLGSHIQSHASHVLRVS